MLANDLGLTPGNSFLCDPACARELLLRSADPNVSGPRGYSPLRYAMTTSSEETMSTSLPELLLEYGAKLEPDLLFVVVAPRVKFAELRTKFLLAKGLDPNSISAEWGTPLHLAVYSAKPIVVKLLLDAGADPTVRAAATTKYPGQTPAQVAEKIGRMGFPDTMQTVLDILQSGG